MEQPSRWRSRRISSYDQKVVAIILTIVAILSPLYVDRRNAIEDEDPDEEEPFHLSSYLPVFMLVLIMAISLSNYLDSGGLTRFDPNWIHRVGGSSTGIVVVLLILALVLKFRSF